MIHQFFNSIFMKKTV